MPVNCDVLWVLACRHEQCGVDGDGTVFLDHQQIAVTTYIGLLLTGLKLLYNLEATLAKTRPLLIPFKSKRISE